MNKYRIISHSFSIFSIYRKASFVQAFTEEEFKNSNIRYLFPEGCESPKIEVEIPPIEKMGTAEELPTEFPTELPTESPCTDFCCEDNRPQIFFPRSNQNSCCKSVSKLVVPIDLTILDNVPTAAIAELSNEIDPVLMLVKLMKLIENTKY